MFDIHDSHSLSEIALKGLANSGAYLARKGVAKAIKSDYAKKKIKNVANKYLDQVLDSFTSNLSKRISPTGGGINEKTTKPYCGIKKVPVGKHRGSAYECMKKGGVSYYGLNEIDKRIIEAFEKTKMTPYRKRKLKKQNELKNKIGKGLDIHKAILKVAPKKGFVMPGHRYTGPGNPLEQQLRYDPNTGQILEIYQQPTGKTDAVSMQHDVDYLVCGNKPKSNQVKCKKKVKALDAIPWKERQWGHAIARNAIAAKSKLGMGVKKPKNGKSRRVKKTGKKN